VARAAGCELERSSYTVIRFTESYAGGDPRQSSGAISRASKIFAETKPVRIIVCLRSPLDELPVCEIFGQQIRGVPVETGHEAYERLTGKIFLDERTPLHLLCSHACLSSRMYSATKRFLSAAVAAMVLLPALPVMAVIALFIYVTEGGPVLFVQDRVGLHGRSFRLLKFRSMRVEKSTSSEWERDNEDRITALGRWLRRLHLDELPQLWNILRGDMDLVGPRPHPVSNYELFARSIPYYSLRSLIRPGLTGRAQVRQGYAHDLLGEIEKMRYDLCAIARPSLLSDLWVLLATVKIILLSHALKREALPVAEKAECDDTVAFPRAALPERAPLLRTVSEVAQVYRTSPAAIASAHRPLKGFARVVAVVAALSITSATLRMIPKVWNKAQPEWRPTRPPERTSPTTAALAMTVGPHESTSPASAATTGASDLASLDAAAARAKAVVQGSEIPNAKIRRPVVAKRIGGGSSVNGLELPRYQAEVGVEIKRRFGAPIQRKYFITLQDVGSGEWQIESMEFATRY
jgi:lipopolysaccharide/colanic/teichoic acid biosynthesis glycosyltransferase